MNWDELSVAIDGELTAHPKDYLRQHWISKTIHTNQRGLTDLYWKELIQNAHFVRNILPAALDSPAGNPQRYEPFPLISPQGIQHAYYIRMMEQRGFFRTPPTIVEIGGGYGNLARIMWGLCPALAYRIVDLPVMHRLQQTFLGAALPGHGIEFVKLAEMPPAQILIGTFSISEMPMEQRDFIESRMGDYQRIFIALNESFCGFQNVPYFQALANRIGAEFFKDKHRNAWFVVR